jgi:hypothetical protein
MEMKYKSIFLIIPENDYQADKLYKTKKDYDYEPSRSKSGNRRNISPSYGSQNNMQLVDTKKYVSYREITI